MLQCAEEMLGGPHEVAKYLGVSPARVRVWMRGTVPLPGDMFLRLVDLLSAPRPAPSRRHFGKPRNAG